MATDALAGRGEPDGELFKRLFIFVWKLLKPSGSLHLFDKIMLKQRIVKTGAEGDDEWSKSGELK